MFPPMCPRPTKPIFAFVVAISCPPFDHHDVLVAELEVGRADDRINLIRSAEARTAAAASPRAFPTSPVLHSCSSSTRPASTMPGGKAARKPERMNPKKQATPIA